jgi:hypothetical protein
MAKRNNSQIRRDINRLNTTIQRHTEIPSLTAIAKDVSEIASKVDGTYRSYQLLVVQGNSERSARDTIMIEVSKWMQEWRPVVLLKIPGAQDSIRALPNSGVTPDDIISVAKDLLELVKVHPEAKEFSEKALEKEPLIIEADTKVSNAASLFTQEREALRLFSAACTEANNILVRGSEIVRTVFGKTSPEYKKLISKTSVSDSENDTTDDNDNTNEDDTTTVDNAQEEEPVAG